MTQDHSPQSKPVSLKGECGEGVKLDGKHSWFQRFGLTCCKLCGIVRRADGNNSRCPGPVRVGLRSRVGAERFVPTDTVKLEREG
jgi:hypothetical protein